MISNTATVTIYRSTITPGAFVARYELLDHRGNLLFDRYANLASDAAVDGYLNQSKRSAEFATLALTIRDRREGIPAGEWV